VNHVLILIVDLKTDLTVLTEIFIIKNKYTVFSL